MIAVLAGLPGTGKSTLARALAARTGGAVIDKDSIRAALFAPHDVEYSAGQDDFVLSLMLQAAAWLLRRDPARHIFIDGRTFSRRYQIELVQRFAGENCRIIECVCAEATARSRIERDLAQDRPPAKNRDWALYCSVRDSFEPIEDPKCVVDTGQPIEACVERVLAFAYR